MSTDNLQAQKRGRLLKVLGFGFGLAVIIGNTIGAGIFRAPGTIAAALPDPWLFLGVWIVGGLYALFGAIALAELGTMIPKSGGQYVFARYALGEYAGFIVGWSDWISTCGTAAAVSLAIGGFAGVLIPALSGTVVIVPGLLEFEKPALTAALVAIFFGILQWRGIVWGSTTQNITSLVKTLAFLALVIAALALGGNGAFTTPEAHIAPGGFLFVMAVVVALQSVIYTYDGWNAMIYFSEEVENPGRDIPRALLSGVVTVILIYLLVNVALLHVLPISKIAGQQFPAGVAAEAVFGHYGNTILLTITILSMLSAINAYHLMSTRVLFAMSRDGLFAKQAARVNPGGTPTVALLLSAVVAVVFILFGEKFERVIAVLAFFFVANYMLSFIAVFVLRRREPEKERPFRVWGYPWTTGIALLGSVAFLIGAVISDVRLGSRDSFYALGLLAVSYPIFRLMKLSRE